MKSQIPKCFQAGVYTFLIFLLVAGVGCSFLFESNSKFVSYLVKRGDTLASISANFDLTVDELADANDIDNPNAIYAGQLLKVPLSDNAGGGAAGSDLGLGRKNYEVNVVNIRQAKLLQGKLQLPVRGARLSSRFGRRWFRFHEGIDLSAPQGTPIFAAHQGQVIYSGTGMSGYGNVIAIRGDFGLVTVYAHNQRNLVKRGQWVDQGHLIGYVGKTGNAKGAHLHFETRLQQTGKGLIAVDPQYFFRK